MTPIAFYFDAKRQLVDQGFAAEISWQERQKPTSITEENFLREAAWVVYCSGFREATVRRCFDYLSLCFFDWSSAHDIATNGSACVSAAMNAFANRRKHEAVVTIASRVAAVGFKSFKRQLLNAPVQTLQGLPFLGPVTAVHLAKNIGFDIAKPDRHLVRLKDQLGFTNVSEMCQVISTESGDPVKVVDLVLWRFIEQHGVGRTSKALLIST